MSATTPSVTEELVYSSKILLIDDNVTMRKVVRSLLMVVGIKTVFEAADGISGLEAIGAVSPDVVFLDWEMPSLDGPEFMHIVRSESFPHANIPVIMLTGHCERWRVVEAMRLGVNEFLVKPVSAKALLERIIAVRTRPRRIVKIGGYYGPEPRRLIPAPDAGREPRQRAVARA